jgi:uncharacterized membrane protein YfcA
MKILNSIIGFIIGIINSLLGAGGGMITVPYLNHKGLTQQESQATSMLVILPLSVISTLFYLKNGNFRISDALIFLPAGIVGAVIGGLTLKKIPSSALKIIFSAFMVYAGIRMMFR